MRAFRVLPVVLLVALGVAPPPGRRATTTTAAVASP